MVSSPVKTQESGVLNPSINGVQTAQSDLRDSLVTWLPQKSKGQATIPVIKSRLEWGTLSLPENRLFGTDGIRGRAGDLLTPALVLQLGFWAGQVLQTHATKPGPVVIGQDSRNSSSMLAMALSAGLTAAGLEVWDLGLCPTPGVAHLTSSTEAIGGVMISASHNPPEDNGIKFFGAQGNKLPLEAQEQIEAALRGQTAELSVVTDKWGQRYQRPELLREYCTSLKEPLITAQGDSTPLKGMRIVLDLAWGAAVELAPRVFQALGAEVICLHDRPDGDRINVNCGSTHLGLLKDAVMTHRADLGFAFDGDADRVLAVDNQGRAVDGDYILYLWGMVLRQENRLPGQAIVATVMSNLGFERAWEQQGGTLIRAAVGDQYVHAEMLRHGAVLGGEQSGHILCRHFGVSGDGLLTALHLAQLIQQSGLSLADLVNQSFQTYPQKLKNVRVEDRVRRLQWQECEPLRSAIAQAEAAMGNQGRVLVRASGTEPLIRVMVEAVTHQLVNQWTEALVKVVEQNLA
ncbi:phosphoglucosamine mutase [Leptodesmis sp.]|uniref:phosphoglucosamine mutase n=1 Tax=Leptodesmis sp. TaxID=3100501 RepID=UPI0040535772